MLKKLDTIWLPAYTFVATDDGWAKVTDIRHNTVLMLHNGKKIEWKNPKTIEEIPYNGNLYGFGKIAFKPENKISSKDIPWFTVQDYLFEKDLPSVPIPYNGKLLRFDFNPIVYYGFFNEEETIEGRKLTYIILQNNGILRKV